MINWYECFVFSGNMSLITASQWTQGQNVSSLVFKTLKSMLGKFHFYFSSKYVIWFKYNVCACGWSWDCDCEFLSGMHAEAVLLSTARPQQAFACRDLLNTFTSCELILQVFVCLTETRLSTDNQSWMGFSKYYSFTQCWWLLGFFFIC